MTESNEPAGLQWAASGTEPSTFTNLRMKLYSSISAAMAGHPLGASMAATLDALATTVLMACTDEDEVDGFVDGLTIDLKTLVHANWTYVKGQGFRNPDMHSPGHA